MERPKNVLTTGQVAKICNVAPRTVSKWFDSGQLKGYRIPGSKDRRIPTQALIRFMKAHGIPLDKLETGHTRLLVIDDEPDLTQLLQDALAEVNGYTVRTAASIFEAGALTEAFRPGVMVVDMDLPGVDVRSMTRYIAANAELQGTRLIAMSASMTDSDRQAYLQQGFANTLAKPFNIQQFLERVEETLATFEHSG